MMSVILIVSCFYAVLCVGGYVSDYIFPRIKILNRFIESRPMMRDYRDE